CTTGYSSWSLVEYYGLDSW
nr:immunoglobulin heavy chain junction region [Macaca mulatta]